MKVCACCFNDEEIKQFIISSAAGKTDCSYCGNYSEYMEINELLDFFSNFIAVFSKDNNGIPLNELIQKDWNLFSPETNYQEILSEILQLLKIELSVVDKVTYIPDIKDCIEYWDILKEDLKWNRRFLSDTEHLIELQWDTLFSIYSIVDKNKNLYRARIHTDGGKNTLGFDSMGCPPKNKSVAGRANPQGIPYLYLCNDIETTLYETRVSYLDIVSIGTFQLKGVDELKIVDFTQCQSPFSDDIINMVEFIKGKLLRQRISQDLSKPMRRFDSELEYIPTQFICEFVRYITGAQGIQFNSALHQGGVNVVLFSPEYIQCIDEQIYTVTGIRIKSEIVN
jgi:hypothetical protein